MLFFVAACTITNGHAGRGTESILYAPRPLKMQQDPTPYYPDASKRAKETGELILHFGLGPPVNFDPISLLVRLNI
jgi:hypothetical protein